MRQTSIAPARTTSRGRVTFVRRCLVALIASSWAAAGAHAESMRCGSALAEIGDTKADIRLKCGDPVAEDSRCEPLTPAGPHGNGEQHRPHGTAAACEPVDEWTYNPGRGQFLTTLRFVRGKLESMTYGDRVP